ncbi:DUF3131 domain-containing protein [Klebsiella pneumoniae subsp. pneumoniae]|nr:DUF3131 domain-containing protein [Klebsiella pneumoniae subsp. pneumoniae]
MENGDGPINEFTANNNGIMLEALLFKKRRQTAAVFQRQSEKPRFRAVAVGQKSWWISLSPITARATAPS